MNKNDIIRKLTSRKLLLAIVGVVSGLALAFGVEGSEITEIVSAVGGILAAVGSAIAYIKAEGRVDEAAAGKVPELDHNIGKNGAPGEAQRSGFAGERTSIGGSEPSTRAEANDTEIGRTI